MSVAEMKLDVIYKITTVENEQLLHDVLDLLNNVSETKKTGISLASNYKAIKKQYGEVLEKLAQ